MDWNYYTDSGYWCKLYRIVSTRSHDYVRGWIDMDVCWNTMERNKFNYYESNIVFSDIDWIGDYIMECIILILENLNIVLLTLLIFMLIGMQWMLHWTRLGLIWILNKTQ